MYFTLLVKNVKFVDLLTLCLCPLFSWVRMKEQISTSLLAAIQQQL